MFGRPLPFLDPGSPCPLPGGSTASWFTIELYIGQAVLEAVLEDNIAAIIDNREELDQDGPADITDGMLVVRWELLAWVRAHPGLNIFVSIYPVDEAPMADEDGA